MNPVGQASAQREADSLSRLRERARVRARELRQTLPDAERVLWQCLRDRQLDGRKFRRQRPMGRYFVDFACIEAKLIVELDGGQHFSPEGVAADAKRTAELMRRGFHVLRFTDREVVLERDAVLQHILNWLATNHPHPSPLPHAGEGAETELLPREGRESNTHRTDP